MRKGFLYGMFGCFGVGAALIIVIIVVSAIATGSRTGTNPSASAGTSLSNPARGPAAAKAWVPLISFSGNGPKKTPTFTVGSHWRVHYINHGDGNFIVHYVQPGEPFGTPVTNVIGNIDQTSEEYEAGTFYFEVQAGDNWVLGVDDFR